MAYLVDGNNVMAQRVGWHRDKKAARRRLMDELARFAKERKSSIAVVFDGKPEEFFPDGSSFKGIKVFYAEPGSNADERIKRMVDTAREKKSLTVVTSDRELASYVRRNGVKVVRSGEFRKLLDETIRQKPSPDNQPEVSDEEVPEWMRYFGVDEEDEG